MEYDITGPSQQHIIKSLNSQISRIYSREQVYNLMAEMAVWVADNIQDKESKSAVMRRSRLGIPRAAKPNRKQWNGNSYFEPDDDIFIENP